MIRHSLSFEVIADVSPEIFNAAAHLAVTYILYRVREFHSHQAQKSSQCLFLLCIWEENHLPFLDVNLSLCECLRSSNGLNLLKC